MKILIVVPPLAGHINPTLALGAELIRRGHRVAWVGHRTELSRRVPPIYERYFLDDQIPLLELNQTLQGRTARGLRAFKELWADFFIPLAKSALGGLEVVMTDYEPDMVLTDQQMLAGALACRRLNLPWVTSSTTSAGVLHPFRDLPTIGSWLATQLDELQAHAGLTAHPVPDRSPLCTLVFSSKLLVGPAAQSLPSTVHFVGPAIQKDARPPVEFPWSELSDSPLIYLSLGTVNQAMGGHFYRTAFDALADGQYQAVVVGPKSLSQAAPSNIVVVERAPQLDILERATAVVTHGGHNTVCESLINNLPLIATPIKDDQPIVAQQVADAGAGLRLRFNRFSAKELRSALSTVINQVSYRRSAEALGASLRGAGGPMRAADIMESLL